MNLTQKLDPRAWMVSLGIISLLPMFVGSWTSLAVSSGSLVVAAICAGISPLRVMTRTVKISWFVATIIVLQALAVDGHVVFAIGDLLFTREGIEKGLGLSARLVVLLWGSSILIWSTSPERIMAAFETWLYPVRHRLGAVVMLVTVTMNLIPALVLQSRRLALSFRSRGVDIETGIVKRVLFLSSAALPLFASTSRTATQLATAMESRSYDPSAQRTTFISLRFGMIDWLVLILTGILALTCLVVS